jgi:hypothetical protein
LSAECVSAVQAIKSPPLLLFRALQVYLRRPTAPTDWPPTGVADALLLPDSVRVTGVMSTFISLFGERAEESYAPNKRKRTELVQVPCVGGTMGLMLYANCDGGLPNLARRPPAHVWRFNSLKALVDALCPGWWGAFYHIVGRAAAVECDLPLEAGQTVRLVAPVGTITSPAQGLARGTRCAILKESKHSYTISVIGRGKIQLTKSKVKVVCPVQVEWNGNESGALKLRFRRSVLDHYDVK